MTSGRGAEAPPEGTSDAFSIPELCTVPALIAIVLVAELLALLATLLGDAPSWYRLGTSSLFVQWTALCSAGALCMARGALARMSLALGGTSAWLLVVLVTGVFAVMAELIVSGNLGVYLAALFSEGPRPERGQVNWFNVGRLTITGAIIAGMVLRYLYVQQRLRLREQAELRLRLQALQSRIRPHFLFNSMNIIASLIAVEPETAETVVEDLSELFRASLNEAGNQVPLQVELDLCQRYVRIEQLRLGERLQVAWNLPSVPADIQIPLLTLQPLLENAVYHGIQPLPEGGLVTVDLELTDDRVTVSIGNPLPPEGDAVRHSQGNRIAMANIRSRLEVLYGPDASLEAGARGERFVTRLSYPLGARTTEPSSRAGGAAVRVDGKGDGKEQA